MKVALFLTWTIAGTLAVLFGTLGVGQLASGGSPAPVLLAGLGLLAVIGGSAWWVFRRALAGTGNRTDDDTDLIWTRAARSLLARKFTVVGSVLAAALALGVAGFSLSTARAPLGEALDSLSYYAQGMFLLTAVVSMATCLPLGTALRDAAGTGQARQKQLSKAVLGGKDLPLDEAGHVGAARMAAVAPVVLPLQNSCFAYLYASLATQYVRFVSHGEGGAFSAIVLALIVATVLLFVPFLARQVNRARHYAHEHAALLAG